jgi:plasmid stabilization system protein ParE
MRYTVVWLSAAEDELARIWNAAPDRQAVTRAADQADRVLSTAPDTQGQEFYGDWLLDVTPLHLIYNFSPDDRLVRVLDLWHD